MKIYEDKVSVPDGRDSYLEIAKIIVKEAIKVSVPDGRDSYLELAKPIRPLGSGRSQSLTAGIPIWREEKLELRSF